MIRTTALYALLVTAIATSTTSAQEPIVRSYGVRDLLATVPPFERGSAVPLLLPRAPALPSWGDGSDISVPGGPVDVQPHRSTALSEGKLMEWLEEAYANDDTAQGEILDETLILRGNPGTHARVQELLSVLGGLFNRTARLSLHVLPAAAAGVPAFLDRESAQEALAQYPPLRSHSVVARADVPFLHEAGRIVHVLADYDVEVAERSSISDPKIDMVFLGDRLGAAGTPLVDGRWWIRWGWSATSDLPSSRRSLAGTGLGTMDLPRVDTVLARGTAALTVGDAFVFGGDGDRLGPCMLVLEAATTPPLRIGNTAALPLGPLGIATMPPGPRVALVRRPGDDRHLFAGRRSTKLQDLRQLLDLYLHDAGADDAGLKVVGSHAVFTGGTGQDRLQRVAAEQTKAVTCYALQFRLGTLPKGSANDPGDIADRLPHSTATPSLLGQGFEATHRTEQSYVRDYDVEIASRAGVANPVIDILYSGWSVQGRLGRDLDGRPLLTGRFQWSQVLPIASRDTGIPEIGAIDQPEICLCDTSLRLPLRPDSWQVAYAGPAPDAPDDRVLYLLVRLTPQR